MHSRLPVELIFSGLNTVPRIELLDALRPFCSHEFNEIRYGSCSTPWQTATLVEYDGLLTHLAFTVQNTQPTHAVHDPQWAQTIADRLWANPLASSSLDESFKLLLVGTPFQIHIWLTLLTIPTGEIRSYGEVAAQANCPRSVRTVATAIGKNSIAYLIPCHRVIYRSGKTGNYRWGAAIKQALLDREARSR